jgi:tRNA-2-methylthio-N6-dimethylallyladenosine synthase
MKKRLFHIKSFGCQMNKLDSSLVASALRDNNWAQTDTPENADVVIINTCSVRGRAEEKALSAIGRFRHIKKTKPLLAIAVIGCMAQRMGSELLTAGVDIVCGPAQIPQMPNLLAETLKTKTCAQGTQNIATAEKIRSKPTQHQRDMLDDFERAYDSDTDNIPAQAFVRVMFGCNNMCSYCIVPYVRGPEISRPPQTIIKQIKKLAGSGVKLITLLGQTVNSYEYKTAGKTYCLADLLEMASQVDGIEWIRFVTSYPSEKYFDQICNAMAALEKVCPYLHIPAQSGSDKILKAMNRRYTASQYLDLLDRARQAVPDIAIAGDFIVGFPGETDEDFNATAELLRAAEYKNCFIFKYSPRPGTEGHKQLTDDVPMEIKKQRNIELLAIQEQVSGPLSEKFLNRTVRVLVESLSKKPHLNQSENQSNPQLVSRTSDDWIVVFNGPQSLTGQFANVKITKTAPLTLFGQLE